MTFGVRTDRIASLIWRSMRITKYHVEQQSDGNNSKNGFHLAKAVFTEAESLSDTNTHQDRSQDRK